MNGIVSNSPSKTDEVSGVRGTKTDVKRDTVLRGKLGGPSGGRDGGDGNGKSYGFGQIL